MRACGAQHLSSCCSLRCLVCTAWCASSGCTTSFCAGLRPLQFEQQLEASLRKKKQQERLNEEREAQGLEPLLSVTRAWRLVKFVDNGMLTLTRCNKCSGRARTRSWPGACG